MKTLRTVFCGALALTLAGCGLFDSRELWSSGNYVVLWIDAPDRAHLAYRVGPGTSMGISDPCVSAVAENARYIAVEQRPPGSTQPPMYLVYAKQAPTPREPPVKEVGRLAQRNDYEVMAALLELPPMQRWGGEHVCGREI